MQKLQRVWQEVDTAAPRATSSGLTLVDAVDEGPSWKLWNLLAHSLDDAPDPVAVQGLYLFGGVGSGKTMLMVRPAIVRVSAFAPLTRRYCRISSTTRCRTACARSASTSTTLCWTCTAGCAT